MSTVFAATGALLPGSAAVTPKNQYYELQYFRMKTGPQTQRTNEFFANHYAPAVKRLGLPPAGFFNPVIGEESPYLLMVVTHPALDSIETRNQRLQADDAYRKALDAYLAGDPPYLRREVSLLKAFDGMPALQAPAPRAGGHIFEMRTYESNTSITLARKIRMFEDGEIAIFKRLGMTPVFFAQTMFGRAVPNLTYMLAFDDLAHREKLWKDFGADADWQKLRARPGLSDAEIVSNISNTILRPAAFSQLQ